MCVCVCVCVCVEGGVVYTDNFISCFFTQTCFVYLLELPQQAIPVSTNLLSFSEEIRKLFTNFIAPDKALFQHKSMDIFLISPQKHMLLWGNKKNIHTFVRHF